MIVLLIAINMVSLILLGISFRIQISRIRIVLILLLLSLLTWSNGVLLLYQPWFPDDARLLSARFMFGGSMGTVLLCGIFVPLFLDGDKPRIRMTLGILLLTDLGFVVLSFSPYIVQAVAYTPEVLRISYGSLQPVYVLMFWATGVTLLYMIYRGKRRAQREMEKTQLNWLLYSSAISFFSIFISNGILPIVLGHSNWSFLGPLFITAFYAGVLYLILEGDILYAKQAFNALITSRAIRSQSANVQNLRRIVGTISYLMENRPEVLEREFAFVKSQRSSLTLSLRSGKPLLRRTRSVFSPGWIAGHYDRLQRLERENMELFLAGLSSDTQVSRSPHDQAFGADQEISEAERNLTPLERAERRTILAYLTRNRFNQASTSRELGIRPNTVIVKMRKYGIVPPGGVKRVGRKRVSLQPPN